MCENCKDLENQINELEENLEEEKDKIVDLVSALEDIENIAYQIKR